ncbi:hypothetical protein MFRU_058g00240 [Monilinia fructicola]|nr:hypothetical protein MFRU_058g00240 [Monilinia fructicola]
MSLQNTHWICCRRFKEPEGTSAGGQRNESTVEQCTYCLNLICEQCEVKEDGKALLGIGKSFFEGAFVNGRPVVASEDDWLDVSQGCGIRRPVAAPKDDMLHASRGNEATSRSVAALEYVASQGSGIGRPVVASEDDEKLSDTQTSAKEMMRRDIAAVVNEIRSD